MRTNIKDLLLSPVELNIDTTLTELEKIKLRSNILRSIENHEKNFNEIFKFVEKNNEILISSNNINEILSIINNKKNITSFFKSISPYSINSSEKLNEKLNIFNEAIREDISLIEKLNSSDEKVVDSNFLNNLIYLILLILSLYVQNLDKFTDIKESIIFYINNIECKGVTISRVNLRKEPNYQSDIILTVKKDSVLKIYKENNNGWVKVSVNINNLDIEGYINKVYLKSVKD